MTYPKFSKIARLGSPVTITEKIDGTNGLILIQHRDELDYLEAPWTRAFDTVMIFAGSRSRWLTPENDNHGFAAWVVEHGESLYDQLGTGYHYGEFWGRGIQRGYDLDRKVFSVFDTRHDLPESRNWLMKVPTIYAGPYSERLNLSMSTSRAAPGYEFPEGVVIRWDHDGSRKKVVWDKQGPTKPSNDDKPARPPKPQWTPEQIQAARAAAAERKAASE